MDIKCLLILITIWNIRRENKKRSKRLFSFLLIIVCLFAIVISAFFTTLTIPPNKDAIVYQNENDLKDKIICQFFITGIFWSHVNWRVIETSSQDKIIRKIKIIKKSEFFTQLKLPKSLPREKPKISIFLLNDATYHLESYMTLKGENYWVNVKIEP